MTDAGKEEGRASFMTSCKRAKAVQDQESFLEILDRFVKKAVEDFPELEGKFVLYDLSTDTFYGSFNADDNRAHAMSKNLRNFVKKFKKESPNTVAFTNRRGDYFQIAYLRHPKSGRTIMAEKVSRELEHEFAHIVLHWGLGDEHDSIALKGLTKFPSFMLDRGHSYNFEESEADVFSFVRQRQQYQDNENLLEAQIWNRAISLINNGKTDHFTLPVLKEFDRLSQSNDLSKLTLVQTGNLAYRMSLQYTLAENQLRKLAKIFAPFREKYNRNEKELSEPALRKCAKIMLEDHGKLSQMTFTSGKTFLAPFLNDDKNLISTWVSLKNIPTFTLEGDFWNDISAKIKEREYQIKETPEQIRTREAIDMQMLGFFDKDPNGKINPKEYRLKENLAYLRQKREDFIKDIALKQGALPSTPSLR